MQLQQVNRLALQIAQTLFYPAGQILSRIAFDGLLRQPPARLGRHHDRFLPHFFELRNQPFAPPVSVHIRGINKIHAAVNRLVQGAQRLGVAHLAPRPSNRPGSKADFRYFPGRPPQLAISHKSLEYDR